MPETTCASGGTSAMSLRSGGAAELIGARQNNESAVKELMLSRKFRM
jgi:hypothetical protein